MVCCGLDRLRRKVECEQLQRHSACLTPHPTFLDLERHNATLHVSK
jgi:hypothetical protein